MKRKLIASSLLFFAAVFAQNELFAQGSDSPTGVTGDHGGTITTAGTYSPQTRNVSRTIDDLIVPSAVGSYPLKFTRYWNGRAGETYSAWSRTGWSFSYVGYRLDTSRGLVYFPDGRVFSGGGGDNGVPEISRPDGLYLADGGKIVFKPNRDLDIFDPYGHKTTVVTTGTGANKVTIITEPAGRYLKVLYEVFQNVEYVSRVEAWIPGQTSPIDWVTYIYQDDFALEHTDPQEYARVLSEVHYTDQTTATYEYLTVLRPRADSDPPPGAQEDPDVREPGLWKCHDTRYPASAMNDIMYGYERKPDNEKNKNLIKSEHHISGAMLSSISHLDTDPPAKAGAEETRGDNASAKRRFAYGGMAGFPEAEPRAHTGKLIWYTDFEGNRTDIHYQAEGEGTTAWGFIDWVKDAKQRTTTYTRQTNSWGIKQINFHDGTNIKQTFYPNNSETNPWFLESRTDENGERTDYERNDPLNPNAITKKIYPADNTGVRPFEEFQYNQFGQVLRHRLKDGSNGRPRYQHFEYDRGLLKKKSNPTWNATLEATDAVTTYTHYTSGPWTDRIETETDPRGNVAVYEYDHLYDTNGENSGTPSGSPCPGRGLVTKISYPNDTHGGTVPNGTSKIFAYDKYGNKLWEQNELGHRTNYFYDEYNRQIRVVTPAPINGTTTYDYSPQKGQTPPSYLHTSKTPYFVTVVTDPADIVTKNEYDRNWRPLRVTEADGTNSTTHYHYDPVGNQDWVTDPRGSPGQTYTTRTEYDARNRK